MGGDGGWCVVGGGRGAGVFGEKRSDDGVDGVGVDGGMIGEIGVGGQAGVGVGGQAGVAGRSFGGRIRPRRSSERLVTTRSRCKGKYQEKVYETPHVLSYTSVM